MILFERIKDIGRERGLSVKDVAIKAGIGENAIYRWKTSSPTTEKLQAVADVLGVSVDYLLGNTDDPNPPSKTDKPSLTKNQELIAYSIDPDISDEERQAIIEMVKQAMKFRRRA